MSDSRPASGVSRRGLLRSAATVTGVAGLSAVSGCMQILRPAGLRGNKSKDKRSKATEYPPMQFMSQRHRVTKEMATHVVSDRSSLIEAVSTAEAIVWIPNDVTIDMTGTTSVPIAPNVTIASGRLLSDKRGGMIKTNSYDKGVFYQSSSGCRITGLRLMGPRTDYFEPRSSGEDESDYSATCFKLRGETAIVDHCEVLGWTFAGILLGSSTKQTRGWIHHNSMHHNQMNHLGYPIELYNGLHLIEWNYFDYNRHSISGFGYEENGYEARFNVVGSHAIQHAFDMHNLGENLDGLSRRSGRGRSGGKFVNVHHNVFELTSHSAFSIQGQPEQYVRFCQNWCAEQRKGSITANTEGVVYFPAGIDMRMKNNKFGSEVIEPGRKWLTETTKKLMDDSESTAQTPPKPTPTPINLEQLLNSSETTDTQSKDTESDLITGAPLTPTPGE